jgi:hypothetical protein
MSAVELQQQLQQQVAAMQQQFAAEKQQMSEQMQRMVQENQQLRSHSSSASSSASAAGPAHSSSPPVSAPRIDIRLMQPSPFHGTASSNATQWLLEVERYFLAVNLVASTPDSSRTRIMYASTFLKDTASMWYFSVSAELGSWDEFKDKFLSRFQPIAAAKVARAQLRLLKQRHRVAGYSQEFMRLIQLIPDMNLADQIESYIVGLQNDLAIEVDKKEPQSLAEAMEFAQRIELMTTGRRQAYGRVPGLYNFSRSASSSSSNYHGGSSGDRMDLSAIRDADEAHDFHYGNEHPSSSSSSSSVDSTLASTVEHVLHGMFQRAAGGAGPRRGGMRGNGPRTNTGPTGVVHELSKDEYNQLSREGKCFKCKTAGHLARNCTGAKPKN